MLNDRDDDNKYEAHEEGEYHFTDDEVHYEEPQPESSQQTPTSSEPKAGALNKITRKRMAILGVFVVLIVVVYKMVSPTTPSLPPTDFVAQPVVTKQNIVNAGMPTQPSVVVENVPASSVSMPITDTVNRTIMAPPPTSVAQTQGSAANTTTQQPVSMSPAMQMAQQLAQSQNQQVPTTSQAVTASPVTNLPAVIPVQSTSAPVANPTVPSSMFGSNVDEKISALAAESQRISNQLETQVNQKFDESTNQNKNLKDQLQMLSERVSVMENQLNQLVQVLTKRTQASSNSSANTSNENSSSSHVSEARIAYNVQAIIPGRAWLKSDSGETLTVAEGDVIKGVGKVIKIDPYDGVVEVNTGTKSISLSYGTGG